MAISRRLRFEILRRDNHTCRYCGAKAPDVQLVVDHVTPTALGGDDTPENLVACCQPCNVGKSSTAPDAPLVADVRDDALAWAAAVRQALATMDENERRQTAAAERFIDDWYCNARLVDERSLPALTRLAAEHPAATVDELVDLSYADPRVPEAPRWPVPTNAVETVRRFFAAGLTHHHLGRLAQRAFQVAVSRPLPDDDVWRYFCGMAWRELSHAQSIAQQELG